MKLIPQTPTPGGTRAARWSRAVLAASLAAAFAGPAVAETLTWNFTSATPSSGSVPNVAAPTVSQYNSFGTATMIASSSVSTGYTGASGANNAGIPSRVGALVVDAGGSAAFEFTIAPDPTYQFTLTDISFGSRSTSTGPQAYALRSSVDNYATDIVTGTFGNNSTWTLKEHTGLTFNSSSAVTFRLFGYNGAGNASSNSVNWRIDDLALTLTTGGGGGPDTTPPSFSPTTPANGATGVDVATNLVFSANEAVTAVAGKNLLIKRADTSTAQTISVTSSAVTISGSTVTVDPPADLETSTSYYIDMEAGAFVDAASNASAEYLGATTWAFSTPAPAPVPTTSPIVISQYYEGTGTNKWIELHNVSGAPVTLTGYTLTLWTNGVRENWKTEGSVPSSSMDLSSVTLAAGEYYLIGNTANGGLPPHAIANVNNNGVVNFNGDDSLVLYNSATIARANIADAISLVANTAPDRSLYRLSGDVGYSFASGSAYSDFPAVWATKTLAEVADATPADEFYLKRQNIATAAPTIDIFALGYGFTQSLEKVTLNYTLVEGSDVATEYRISETDASLESAAWTPVSSPLVYTLSAGNGTKTVYFQLRNSVGSSAIVSDSINRVSYTYPGSVVISQYSSDSGTNSKYIELSNRTASTVDLTGWGLQLWTNGEAQYWNVTGLFATGSSQVALLDGLSIPAGGTIVIANTAATAPLAAASAAMSSAALNFNGNDSMALYAPGEAQTPVFLADVVSFTEAGNEGLNKSFVRIADTQGFSVTTTAPLTTFPAVWSEVSLETVAAAVSTQNEYLGTYIGGGGTPTNTYGAWALANTGNASAPVNGDHDNDGVKNAVEYIFGATGSSFTTMPAPVSGTVSYPIDATATSATYVIETSPNLTTWTSVVADTSTPGFAKYTLPAGSGKLFVRLHVIVTP